MGPASPCLTDRFRSLRPLEGAQGGSAAGAPPSPTSSTSSSSDGEAAAAASLPSAVQPSEAQRAVPPLRSTGAPLQVVSVVPSPVANRAAATATPDALASAEEGLLSRPASLGAATLPVRSAPAPLERHDPDIDDEEFDRAGGDAGSEGLDADAEAEAEAAAAAAAEAAGFDCAEEWGGDAGADSGGSASADPFRAAGDDGAAATPPWAAAQLDSADTAFLRVTGACCWA